MASWKITPLYFGYTSGKNPAEKEFGIPWLGFYLTNGQQKVLCDTGVKDGFFVNGKSPFGYPSDGGEEYVRKRLSEIGITPDQIDLVIYTHFHWDHAGNCHLFRKATHLFQDAEWKELLNPLPSMQFLRVYDQRVIGEFEKLSCQRVSGDVKLLNGLDLFQAPGHSAGGQCLRVSTDKGVYLIAGDLFNTYFMAYPEITEWTSLDGKRIPLDPEVKKFAFANFIITVYDHYAWYRSQYRMKAMVEGPEFLIPSHDASLIGKTFG